MELEERIERLEKANRQLRTTGIVFALSLLTLLIVRLNFPNINEQSSKGGKDEIRAQSFVLVDENGNNRVTIRTVAGGPRIDLCDDRGKSRAVISVIDGDPSLALYDTNENPRARLRFFKNSPALVFYDEKRDVMKQIP